MRESIFKPKYPSRLYLVLVFMIPTEAFVLWDIFANNNKTLETFFVAGFLALMIVLMPFILIRQIKFETRSFTVEKYLFPAQTIDYSDVTEIGMTSIKTKQGNIATQFMRNAAELRSLLKKRMEKAK
jgi:hypothetical protein